MRSPGLTHGARDEGVDERRSRTSCSSGGRQRREVVTGRVHGEHDRVRPAVNSSGVIEHGEITMRWNRSRWTPVAMATAALIGSAWDTAHDRPAGVGRDEVLDLGPDALLHLGEGLAARKAERRRARSGRSTIRAASRRSASFAPVQSPKSHSSRPFDVFDLAAGRAWRSAPRSRCVRSSGEA